MIAWHFHGAIMAMIAGMHASKQLQSPSTYCKTQIVDFASACCYSLDNHPACADTPESKGGKQAKAYLSAALGGL